MEIACSAIVEVGKCLFDPVKEGFLYLYRYQENLGKLEIQIEDLKAKQATIESLVQEGRNMRLENPTPDVKNWLKKVNQALQEYNRKIEEKAERERERRNCGCCLNWYARYHFSKEAAQMEISVKEIIGQGNFTRVTVVPPTPSVEKFPDDYVAFASTNLILDQIVQALKYDDTKIIGVHGIGGVGKTTLMKILNNKLEEIKLFDKVIMVAVSQNYDVKNIQDGIAKRIGFELPDVNLDIRANKLSERLKEEKAVLMILDDVWSRFELNEVGIPCRSEHEGCKIILTTRNEDICRQMHTQWRIELKVLPEAEWWKLLKNKAGDVVDSDKIKPIANQILKSCKGLPLAIVTIASTLYMEDDELIWNDALRALNSASATELDGVIPQVIKSIRFSYDHLPSEGIKYFLLLCCLFPEDWQIDLSTLLAYGIGAGCFEEEFKNNQEARDKCNLFIKNLKGSSLLQEGYDPEHVVMHDIVRDVAIHIASNEHGFFVRSGLNIDKWPEIEELRKCRRISLMDNKITKLPNNPEYPQLLSLTLDGSPHLETMPDPFFENMRGLVILDLGRTGIQQLPSSISHLKCLRALLLHSCKELKEIHAIDGLEKLETLVLAWTAIQELPKGIKGSTNLKHLDLSGTEFLNVSSNLISSLSCLEELYMSRSFSGWEIGDEGHGSKAHLSEVASLHLLDILHVDVKNSEFLYQDHFASLTNLTRFQIRTGALCSFLRSASRTIVIEDLNISRISDWFKALLQKTEQLSMSNVRGLKNFLRLGARGLNNLIQLEIQSDDEIEYAINVEEEPSHIAFPVLTRVTLHMLHSLISIWKGVVPVGSLNSLEKLCISNCKNVNNLFSAALVQELQNLKGLEIYHCHRMKTIISDEVEEEIVVAGDSVLPQELPKPSGLCNLQYIHVCECNKLKYLLPYRLVKTLMHLEYFKVWNCFEMEEIISIDKEEEALVDEKVLPMLKKMKLKDLPKLRTICKGRPTFHWPLLEGASVEGCPQLKRLPMGSQSAPGLKKASDGREPDDIDVFMKAYTPKDPAKDPQTAAFLEQISSPRQSQGSESSVSMEPILTQVLGEGRSKHVRGLGKHHKMKDVATSEGRYASQKMGDVLKENDTLKEHLAVQSSELAMTKDELAVAKDQLAAQADVIASICRHLNIPNPSIRSSTPAEEESTARH